MVVKRCPHCDQTLPVACKSCHCGHIFISKTKASLPPPPQNQEESESNDSISSMNTIREKRQRAKRENPDFEYCFANVNSLGEPIPVTKRQRNLSSSTDPGYEIIQGEQGSGSQSMSQELRDAIGTGEGSERKKKRGRPKGSKNKPKPAGTAKLPSASPGSQTTPSKENVHNKHGPGRSVDSDKKKRGRPKGSKNKPKSILSSPMKRGDESPSPPPSSSHMIQASRPIIEDVVPVVTREKAAAYSLILGDLNQKMQSQSAFTEQL